MLKLVSFLAFMVVLYNAVCVYTALNLEDVSSDTLDTGEDFTPPETFVLFATKFAKESADWVITCDGDESFHPCLKIWHDSMLLQAEKTDMFGRLNEDVYDLWWRRRVDMNIVVNRELDMKTTVNLSERQAKIHDGIFHYEMATLHLKSALYFHGKEPIFVPTLGS